MARVKLDFGAEIDLLNKDELEDVTRRGFDREWAERARGIKRIEVKAFPATNQAANSGYVLPNTPSQGYVWNVRFIATSLSPGIPVSWYLGSDLVTGLTSTNNLLPLNRTTTSALNNVAFGSGQVWMDPGDYIVVWCSAITSITAMYVVAIEVPAEMAWKLM